MSQIKKQRWNTSERKDSFKGNQATA